MLVNDGIPEPRETRYDVSAAVAEMRASGCPSLDEGVRESLLAPIDPAAVTAHFENQAGRGEQPAQAPRSVQDAG